MSNSSNPYAPDESSSTIVDEETWLQGALLSNIAYGVVLALYVMCVAKLVRQLKQYNYMRPLGLFAYATVIFIISTLFMGSQVKFIQLAFIEDRNFPGGPNAYVEDEFSNPTDEIANVCFVVGNWIMDAFLIWRLVVIFKSLGRMWVIPLATGLSIMLAASVSLGISLLVQMTGSSPFDYVNITLGYYVMSLALNVVATFFIAGRFLVCRARAARLGSEHASRYTGFAAVFIESAALFAIFAILFIVPFGIGNNLANVFIETVSQVQVVASLLIVVRIASGEAWTEHTASQMFLTDPESDPDTVRMQKLTSLQFNAMQSAVPEDDDGKASTQGESTHGRVTSGDNIV
ncbi:uncharacterized protein FIBRA_07462 [Fibroporia radiculosa]|uniref:Uncharacterized protein n=1 Tax=Fibroporia radiculosa TaxID=599839 RepID=J4I0Q5_9APHY|nr:uncharacterized protein FIBRA_07462 [Fibroporia radiculosa]CCM05252.1 predicted protein [Fibroporia radiculosa]